ncbi:hypothetical protein GOP80_07485 [Planococcaceae bacterium Storch 2/2-2]|nr:hypothetical protein [Planococcaceae bacterium Storch 2/2-2]
MDLYINALLWGVIIVFLFRLLMKRSNDDTDHRFPRGAYALVLVVACLFYVYPSYHTNVVYRLTMTGTLLVAASSLVRLDRAWQKARNEHG